MFLDLHVQFSCRDKFLFPLRDCLTPFFKYVQKSRLSILIIFIETAKNKIIIGPVEKQKVIFRFGQQKGTVFLMNKQKTHISRANTVLSQARTSI